MQKMKKFIISIILCELAGAIGAIYTAPAINSWYVHLVKPLLNPPNWIFAPVWTILYFLMGVSLYLVWKNDWKVVNYILVPKHRSWNQWSERFWMGDWQKVNTISIFVVQYLLNASWSYLFFGLHSPALGFFGILALWWSILYTMVNFYRISKLSAWILAPYIIWVSFAVYLNLSIWFLNF